MCLVLEFINNITIAIQDLKDGIQDELNNKPHKDNQ